MDFRHPNPSLKKWFDRIFPWASLAMGLWSAFGVARRYEQARRIAWLLGAAWIIILLLAVVRRTLSREDAPWKRHLEYALRWVGQSASQEIMFFVLPFWVRSTTWNSRNALFTIVLLALGVTVLVDAIYVRVQRRIRLLMLHKSLVQFSALAFLVPTLTGAHTTEALALAGAVSGGIAGLAGRFRRPWITGAVGVFLGASLPLLASSWIAPVPLRVEHGVFASGVVDRNPSDTLHQARRGAELWAWTPIFAPAGFHDTLVQEWTRDGRPIRSAHLPLRGGRKQGFRTWSSSARAASATRSLAVETLTPDGQIVGRQTIEVVP